MFLGLAPAGVAVFGLVLVGAVASTVVGVVAWRRRETPGATPFAAFAFGIGGWNLGLAAQMVSPSVEAAFVLFRTHSTISLVASFCWALFAVAYTGRGEWLTRRRVALIMSEPLAYGALTLTNPWHGLLPVAEPIRVLGAQFFVPAYNVLVVGQLVFTYGVMIASFGLIGRFALRTRGGHRRQAATVLASAVAVLLSSLVWYAGVAIVPEFDPAPLVMVGMTLVVGIALFRDDFLSVTPLAIDQLVDEMTDPVVILDGDERVLEANAQARRSFGDVTEPQPLLSDVAPRIAAAITAGKTTVTIESAAGEELIYHVNASTVCDQYDRPQGTLLVLRDITGEKTRQRQLERQNEQLERFSKVVSHDLRNPLSVAMGFGEIALESGKPEHLRKSLDAMADMEALIDDLLTLAREGRVVDDPVRVDFGTAATDAWEFVDPDATLHIEAASAVRADPVRLSELLENLFRNAVEHAGSDVRVRVGVTEDGFYVEDDGPGISAADREAVFESGYTTSEAGTGLGLSIVRTIAEAHGWTIHVEDGTDGGARFVVSGAARPDAGGPETVASGEGKRFPESE